MLFTHMRVYFYLKMRLLIVILSLVSVQSLNILSIFPYEGKSHFLVFQVLLQELVRKGHNVTVISHFPDNNSPPNYHDISLAGTAKIRENEDSLPLDRSILSIMITGKVIFDIGEKNCEAMLTNKKVQQLIKDKNKFDVVLIEQFNSDCGLGIAYKLQAPVVGITTHVLMPYHAQRIGTPTNPSFVPSPVLEGGTKPTFFQKIQEIFLDIYMNAIYSLQTQRNDQKTLAKYYDDIPPLADLAKDIKFMLLYQNFVLTGSRLFPANVIEVGGFHVKKAKSLTADLKTFFEGATHGIVYISFGSVVKSSSFPVEKVQAILEATKEFPQRFIWKWEDNTLVVDKNKVYLSSWLPQVDILAHPKTVAFLSHAGMGGTTEAIHFGVPTIAIPIYGDQPGNAAAIEESGLGVQLHYRDLTKDNLVKALKKVLDLEFQSKVKRLSAAYHDRPMPPLDTAVFWIEFAAKHSNFTFRTAAADLPLYQYLNLDVICVFLAISVGIFYGLSICFRSRNTGKDKKVKHS